MLESPNLTHPIKEHRLDETLTEKDSQVLDLNHHDFQHWPGYVLNVVLHLHLNQPIKDLLLCVHVTIKQIGNSLFEENKGWEFLRLKKVVLLDYRAEIHQFFLSQFAILAKVFIWILTIKDK